MFAPQEIGIKIKALREAKNLSMRALAIQAGVAVSFLSKIETGRGSPTLVTLLKLLDALDVAPTEFLASSDADAGRTLVFPGREMKVLDDGDKMWRFLFSGNPDVKMGMTYEEYLPHTRNVEEERHSCDIGGYVLAGMLTLQMADKPEVQVQAGDAFYVPAGTLHRAFNAGEEVLRMVVVELKHTCATPLKRGSAR